MTRPTPDLRTLAVVLGMSGVVVLLGIVAAQALFPGYDASKSAISDLGAPIELAYHGMPGVITIEQPASAILIGSLFVFSILLLAAARSFRSQSHGKWFWRFLALYAVGGFLLVLSYIPYYEYTGQLIQGTFGADPMPLKIGALLHLLGAGFLFLFGASFVLSSRRMFKSTLKPVALLVGALILAAFALNVAGVDLGLGPGGMERLSAYPLFGWTTLAGVSLHQSLESHRA
jgi:hypothetical membrane protein